MVLTAGTPAATAASLLWCGAPCPLSMTDSASGVTGPRTYAESMATAPVLRENNEREMVSRAVAHADVELSPA